jgi:hemolysin activation/secretion protein
VRGYLQSEVVGDDGILESSELRSPSFAHFVDSASKEWLDVDPQIDDWRIYGFSDIARVWVIGALPGQTDAFTLESIGAGTRIAVLGHFSGLVDVGLPLRSGPSTPAKKPRVSFNVKSEF